MLIFTLIKVGLTWEIKGSLSKYMFLQRAIKWALNSGSIKLLFNNGTRELSLNCSPKYLIES